jgi:tRNA(Ile)-lysidine synthase
VDASNLDPEHTLRNRIRLELLPLLERQYATGAGDAVLRLADIAAEELDWTEPLVDDALAKVVDEQGRISRFLPLDWPPALASRVTGEYLRRLTDARDTGRITTEQLTALLLGGDTGQQVSLPGNLVAKKGYHAVSVGEREPDAPAKPIPARPVLKRGSTRVLELGISLRQQIELADPGPGDERKGRAVFDYERVADGMWVRTWREGDRFKPLGAPGTKKLQDFLVNQKVPQELRHRIPLVVAPGGEVLWVVGYRISDTVKVTSATRIYLVVTVASD